MIFTAILATLCCFAASVPSPCVVGPWGEWSECKSKQVCEAPEVPTTYPVTDRMKTMGKGRQAMAKSMALKRKAHWERELCKAEGTCPEQIPPPSVRKAITPCVGGMAGGYPCNNVDMLAFINLEDLGYTENNVEGNDLWVWHDTDGDGTDYVIMGTTYGSSFVRLTDPVNPEVLGILRTETQSSTWRDMKVVNNHAFIVSEASQHGMQVFDLTRLRDLTADPTREFQPDTNYHEISNTHNIVSNPQSDTVFLVGCTRSAVGTGDLCRGGLHMVDVSDPKNPTFAGCFDQDGYVHDAECKIYNGPDTDYIGREICFCYNEDDFTIADVTDRKSVKMVSRTGYSGSQYTHQGWVTEDNMYALLDDELDEYYNTDKHTKTYVWDIQDLDKPSIKSLFTSTETSIDHNLYIRGNYAHQSNYEAGYRLLEISPEGTLSEVAYFDVLPSRTTAEFYGTWSNYPWLDSNGQQYTVVSSIDYGLFILRPNMAAIEAQKLNGGHVGEMTRFRETISGTSRAQCPHLVEKKECVPESC